MRKKITDYVSRNDLDVYNKIINLEDGCQISERISKIAIACVKDIERCAWLLINNDERFKYADSYDGLAPGYEFTDEADLKSAELFNNDWLYMMAISKVLQMEEPMDCFDTEIYWR